MGAMKTPGVGVHIRRVVHKWLQGRTFRDKLRGEGGEFCNGIYPISHTLPQGGVLSPFL